MKIGLQIGQIELPDALLNLADRLTPRHDAETVSSLAPYSDIIERGRRANPSGRGAVTGQFPAQRALDIEGAQAVGMAFENQFALGLDNFNPDRALSDAASGIAAAYVHQIDLVDAIDTRHFIDTVAARTGDAA
jgi:hypothetical protein